MESKITDHGTFILPVSPSLIQSTKQLPLQQTHRERSSSLKVQVVHPSAVFHISHDVVSSLSVSVDFSEASYLFLLCLKQPFAELRLLRFCS